MRGARQVGKSHSIRTFGKENFSQVHEFNFERDRSLKKCFEGDLRAKEVLANLENSIGKVIPKEGTLLFFDEIQTCPDALLGLRYFYEEMPEFPVIAAGSLLEFALAKISVPVGRVEFAFLYPMSFDEFLRATGREKLLESLPLLDVRQDTFSNPSEIASQSLKKAFKEYIVVGGMPAAVSAFVSTGSFEEVKRVQDAILQSFLDDTAKYTHGELQLTNLEKLIKSAFRHVGREVTYSTLIPEEDYRRSKNSIDLLEKALLLHKVRSCNPSGLPLGAEASEKHFKILFLDVGLGGRLSGLSVRDFIQGEGILAAYEGRIAEQIVGQSLIAEGTFDLNQRHIHCWIRPKANAKSEVDFVISREDRIIPVEVKAGKYGRLRSLHQLMKTYPNIKRAVCLQDRDDVTLHSNILFAPLYSKILG